MKRVELTSVQSPEKHKKVQRKKNTYRFSITLGESNATTCPEYSFADLVKNQRCASDEPFDSIEDDSDVVALAQKFEAKYGSKALRAGKKKWTQEMDDYYDLGEGYDEDDPFIDNTEAYDEVVPSTLTTKHGGFYMNRGKLDFKSLHEESGDELIDSPSIKKTKKKRIIHSDSEGGDFEETGEALTKKFKAMKRKKLLESKENEKKKRKQVFGPDGESFIKKRKKKNSEKLKNVPERAPTPQDSVLLPTPASTALPGLTPASTAVEVATPKTHIVTNGTSSGEHETTAIKDFNASLQETFNAILQETFKDDSSSKSGEEFKMEQSLSEKNTLLPSQLPIELAEAIDNIIKEAKDNKEGKVKFFSADINKLLLDIELGCKNLPWGSRTTIYKHLSEHLPCGTHALQRRAKKLTAGQQEDQLKILAQKLKEAIMKEMPALEERHELDVARAKMEAEIKDENPEVVKEEASTESEEEEKTESNKRKPRGPRRKFQWTSEIKDLLLEVVTTKMKLYTICKTRNQTPEEYLKAYLDSDIKSIWPQGWMQTRMLFKESRAAHEEMTKGTNSQPKQKKNHSSTPSNDIGHALPQETGRVHVSKTEDVIEITDDRTETVVVNLPNSDMKPLSTLTLGGQTKISEVSPGDVLVSVGSSGKFVPPTSTPPWVVLQQTNVVNFPQKYSDITSTPVIAKRITPIPVADSLYTSTAPSSPKTTSAPGGSMSGLQETFNSTAPSSKGRSFLTAFENFANTYSQPDTLPTTQSNQKFGNSFLDSTLSKGASESSLQKVTAGAQLKTVSLLQSCTPLQQMAAVKTSHPEVVNMDISNMVSSVTTPGKCVSPVVSVPRLSTTSPKSIATLIDKESNARLSQVIQKKIQQHEKQPGRQQGFVDNFKSVQNVTNKKRHQVLGIPSNLVKPNNVFKVALNDKQSPSSSVPNSKMDGLQKQQNINSKLPLVPNTSLSKSASSSNNHFKTATIIGSTSGTGSNMQPLNSILLAANTKSSSQQVANNLQQSKGNKQPSVEKHYCATSPPKPQKASTVSNTSPLSQSLLLQNSPLLSQSRGSTPSPQKSPMSPETPSLSLYEQIQSQIRNQDAMEGKALQNLALAMNISGASPNSMFKGLKPAAVREAVERVPIKCMSEAFESKCIAATNDSPRISQHLPIQKSALPAMLNTLQSGRQFHKNVFQNPLSHTLATDKQPGALIKKEPYNTISKEKGDVKLSGPGGSYLGIHLTIKNDTCENYLKKLKPISVLTMQCKETSPKGIQKSLTSLNSKQKYTEPGHLGKIVAPPVAKISTHDLESSSSFIKPSSSINIDKSKKVITDPASELTIDGSRVKPNSLVSTKLAHSLQETFTNLAAHLPEISKHLNLPENIDKK